MARPKSWPIDAFIFSINKTMNQFQSGSDQAKDHEKGISLLKSDFVNDRIEHETTYFLGRFKIKDLPDIKSQETESKIDPIQKAIKDKLAIPDDINIKIEKSRDPDFVKVSIKGEGLKSMVEKIKTHEIIINPTPKEIPEHIISSGIEFINAHLKNEVSPMIQAFSGPSQNYLLGPFVEDAMVGKIIERHGYREISHDNIQIDGENLKIALKCKYLPRGQTAVATVPLQEFEKFAKLQEQINSEQPERKFSSRS